MKRKGFTLIELVMVIVIIGILAAVAVPKFIDLQTEAKQAACDSNVGAIRVAISNYYAKTAVSGTAAWPANLSAVAPYLQGDTVPQCPLSVAYTYHNTTGILDKHTH